MQEEKYLAVDVTKPDAPRTLEEIEISRALFELYEGAVVSFSVNSNAPMPDWHCSSFTRE